MKISLIDIHQFDDFQDIPYYSFSCLENHMLPYELNLFDVEPTIEILCDSWIQEIEREISQSVKPNQKAKDLIQRLKEIMITTNYHLSIYQKDHNITNPLWNKRFKASDNHFPVVFSTTSSQINIDLPDSYVKAFKEGYRFLLAIMKIDVDSLLSFLNDYNETPFNQELIRTSFHHLDEFPRHYLKETPAFVKLYDTLFLKETK
jgi:hypothetical protein